MYEIPGKSIFSINNTIKGQGHIERSRSCAFLLHNKILYCIDGVYNECMSISYRSEIKIRKASKIIIWHNWKKPNRPVFRQASLTSDEMSINFTGLFIIVIIFYIWFVHTIYGLLHTSCTLAIRMWCMVGSVWDKAEAYSTAENVELRGF